MQNVRMFERTTSFREPSRMLRLFKVALAVAWLWMAAVMLASDRIVSQRHALIVAVLFFLFGAALALSLRDVPRPRATWGTVALLLVQALVASIISTDLYYLMAIELSLVLPTRQAAIAFGALTLLTVAEGLWLVQIGRFEATEGLGPLSQAVRVALTLGYSVGLQLVAFAGGLLAATEARARSKVGRLMAELQLTNRLLSERSREAERMDIARELHDTVGHRLAALGVHLDLAGRRADPTSAEALREARASIQELLAEVRQVVGSLRQERPLDLKRSIASLIGGVTSLDVQLTLSPNLDVRDPARAHALLRCIQEGLTNIIHHSQAARAWLDLRQDERGISLRVRDDGQGARDVNEGNGLRGMRERVEALAGTLDVRTEPGAGLELVVWIPEENTQ